MTSSYKEEPLFVKIRICEISFDTSLEQRGLYVEWVRGNTSDKTESLGRVNQNDSTIGCYHTFTRLSVFYKSTKQGPPTY